MPEVLMPEVADSRKHHRDPQAICGGDYFGVFDRSSGLDRGRDAVLHCFLQAIRKRKERV